MNKWNMLRILALAGAVWLIVFGSVSNFWRTVKLDWIRVNRKNGI